MPPKKPHVCITCAILVQIFIVGMLIWVGMILRTLAYGYWSERMIHIAINLLGIAIGLIIAIFQLRWAEWRHLLHERRKKHYR